MLYRILSPTFPKMEGARFCIKTSSPNQALNPTVNKPTFSRRNRFAAGKLGNWAAFLREGTPVSAHYASRSQL